MADASSLMGPLLLKGWGMAAETCDKDQTPLMFDKKNNGSVCCACEPRLAKLLAESCNIVRDGPLYMVENKSQTISHRVLKKDGLFIIVEQPKEVSAPKPVLEEAKQVEAPVT